MTSSPGFLENPFGSVPRDRDSGDPGATSRYRTIECCLPPCQQPRHRNKPIFGAESLRPASLLCTLRAHQSPGEWQHSLPACSLALAGRDLHPLDSNKKFHHLIFGSSSAQLSQRDNNVGDVKHYVHFQLLSHHQHSVWQHQWVAGWNRRDRNHHRHRLDRWSDRDATAERNAVALLGLLSASLTVIRQN